MMLLARFCLDVIELIELNVMLYEFALSEKYSGMPPGFRLSQLLNHP